MSNPALHFITGGGQTEEAAANLANSIKAFYATHLGFSVDYFFYRYHDAQVAAKIVANQPAGLIVLAGHSFGACKAVRVADELPSRFIDLYLFDPVEIDRNTIPNTAGFSIPANVVEALCWTRTPQGEPYSGKITSSLSRRFLNTTYAGNHGTAVWDNSNIQRIGLSLRGKLVIPYPVPVPVTAPDPAPAPVAPVPSPTPDPTPVPTPALVPARAIVSVTIQYSDGTTEVSK